MTAHRPQLPRLVTAGLLSIGLFGSMMAVPASADDVANRDRCIAKGNSASACDCFVGEVSRRVQAGVKPETYRAMRSGEASKATADEDISAMGVLIEANVDAAKKCGVKLK